VAYGKWVIASDRGAIGEVVMPCGNGFLVDVDSPNSLVNILAEVQSAPERFSAPPWVVPALFTLEQHVAELASVYDAAMASPEAASSCASAPPAKNRKGTKRGATTRVKRRRCRYARAPALSAAEPARPRQ
jgi:hypothetical protein